jgi:uncharacterized protein (DUF2147 family)
MNIKQIYFSILFIFCLAIFPNAYAQDNPDAILGKWRSGSGKGIVEIYKQGDQYYGKIIKLKEPYNEQGNPKKDINNPDKNLRDRDLLGLNVLKDFTYKGDNTWKEGKIYDPENGKEYNCEIKMVDEDHLDVRGYIGITLIGRTDTWVRYHGEPI